MVNYQQGKIYKIVSDSTDLVYVGSTAQVYLSQRLTKHLSHYRGWLKGTENYVASYEILQYSDYQIILLENYPCLSKAELHAKEREWILKLKGDGTSICNKSVPSGIIFNNLSEYNKIWWAKNKSRYDKQKKETYTCCCGLTLQKANKTRHLNSKKHREFLNEANVKS